MMQKFIQEICDILNIQVPSISYDTSHFQSATMMAQCNSYDNKIFIRRFSKPNIKLAISLDPIYSFLKSL